MESEVIEGDNPVSEMDRSFWVEFPSTAGHEKSRRKLGGPSPKAKYYLATDSELVPSGKGEKYSERRVK